MGIKENSHRMNIFPHLREWGKAFDWSTIFFSTLTHSQQLFAFYLLPAAEKLWETLSASSFWVVRSFNCHTLSLRSHDTWLIRESFTFMFHLNSCEIFCFRPISRHQRARHLEGSIKIEAQISNRRLDAKCALVGSPTSCAVRFLHESGKLFFLRSRAQIVSFLFGFIFPS